MRHARKGDGERRNNAKNLHYSEGGVIEIIESGENDFCTTNGAHTPHCIFHRDGYLKAKAPGVAVLHRFFRPCVPCGGLWLLWTTVVKRENEILIVLIRFNQHLILRFCTSGDALFFNNFAPLCIAHGERCFSFLMVHFNLALFDRISVFFMN